MLQHPQLDLEGRLHSTCVDDVRELNILLRIYMNSSVSCSCLTSIIYSTTNVFGDICFCVLSYL
jgi:hypothetical protein